MDWKIFEYCHHIGVIQPQQLLTIDLEEFITREKLAMLTHRTIGQDGSDVVMRVLLLPIHLLHCSLETNKYDDNYVDRN